METPPTETSPSLIEGQQEQEGNLPSEPAAPLSAEDLSFGEDIEVDEELRGELLEVFNNPELDAKGRAQALVDLHVKAMQAAGEASAKQWSDTQEQWRNEVSADPEIGGEKLQPALDKIGRLVDEHGSQEFLNVMALTGAGNNVHVVKFLSKVAERLVEAGPVSGAPSTTEKSAAAKLFPSMEG